MDIIQATSSYEHWLAQQIELIPADLDAKHRAMAADVFSFLRATYYRWVQLWNEHSGTLGQAPAVLSVGDLHLENFGTWRDQEGRLVWGINDFDEAYPAPYMSDLVRLAASGLLAITSDDLNISAKRSCAAILHGYATAIDDGGGAFVLNGRNGWLRDAVVASLPEPGKFWKKLKTWPRAERDLPEKVSRLLRESMPVQLVEYGVVHRTSGLGSLGRQRFTAVAESNGGLLAREAKALAPSANVWASEGNIDQTFVEEIAARAVRSADPTFAVHEHWTIRRLSPDCGRVKMKKLADPKDETAFFTAMGRETANIHLGTENLRQRILRDLSSRPAEWLFESASTMVAAVTQDWNDWRTRSAPASGIKPNSPSRRA